VALHPAVVSRAASVPLLSSCFIGALVLISVGFLLLRIGRHFPAAAASLLTWSLLGFLEACVAEQPRPKNHVSSLVEQGRLTLQSPLRWHGWLRDEPAKLPWGFGMEIDLTEVEFEGAPMPAEGGLRLSFTPHPEEPSESALPELHAGDAV